MSAADRSASRRRFLLPAHLGDHFAAANQPTLAAVYYQHARAATTQGQLVRQALGLHAPLSADELRRQADGTSAHTPD